MGKRIIKKVRIRKKDLKNGDVSFTLGCLGFFVVLILFFVFCSSDKTDEKSDKDTLKADIKRNDSLVSFKIAELRKIDEVDSFLVSGKKVRELIQSNSLIDKKYQSDFDSIVIAKVNTVFNDKKYDTVLNMLSIIDSLNPSYERNDTLRYIKTMSLREMGKKKEAAEYLYNLYGKSSRLLKLEDELNPPKKIFSHYQALCYDGIYKEWTATRKGTCRNHGGVNKWNGKAIYHTKRKYEF